MFLPFYGKKLLKYFSAKLLLFFSLLLLILQFTPLIQRFCSEEPEKEWPLVLFYWIINILFPIEHIAGQR